jgi:hypothetical protein
MSILTKASGQDRRRARRLSHMQFVSFIELEAGKRDCLVGQVSETGARVEVEQARALPDEFVLHLSGKVPRRCRVVWRDDRSVGIVWNWHGDASVLRAWRAIFRDS